MSTQFVNAAVEKVRESLLEGVEDRVEESLAAELVSRCDLSKVCEIESGIDSAIDEIDDDTFMAAVEVIERRISLELRDKAKRVAMRLLCELADSMPVAAAS